MPIVGVAGGPCGTNNSCEPGLWCSTVSAPFTCMPLAQAGGPCEPVNGCAAGLICVPGDNGTPSTCMTDARKGEACQAIYQCGGFFSTLVCDETAHKCVDAPKSGPCAGLGVCDFTTSYCDGTQATPTCTPIKALGAACNTTGAGAECGTLSNMKCQATVSGGTTGTCVSTIAVVCTP